MPLLTTKQVQEILKVDRITVYRMLNDGRLKGVKIGNHWRFHKKEIESMLERPAGSLTGSSADIGLSDFPAGCVEKVEDLLAGILGIGVTVVRPDGQPLTAVMNCNPFCQLILASSSGRAACQNCWRGNCGSANAPANFQVCHAGLCFFRAPVSAEGVAVAWVIAGQYRITPPNLTAEGPRLQALAAEFRISLEDLSGAAGGIPVLSRDRQMQVEEWTPRLARTIQSILQERNQLTARLQKISEISAVRPVLAGND